jgi:hypothetical protein
MHTMMTVVCTTLMLGAAALVLAPALADEEAHAQCSNSSCSSSINSSAGANELGWRVNATHVTAACNMPILDASELPPAALAQRLATATTPLLITGMLHSQLPGWRAQAAVLGSRTTLLERFGGEHMRLSVATLLANGPESTQLDSKKLTFMQEAWGAVDGSALRDSVERQVRAGEPRPRVELGDWLTALRKGTAPPDAYVFQNVSGGPVAQALAPLHALWRNVAFAQFEKRHDSKWIRGADPPALMRLGVGGSGSGAPFHDHDVLALNVVFAGRKRWLVTRPCRPNCRIPSVGSAALYHPKALLNSDQLPSAALRVLGAGGDTWDCTQHPGEVVFVPEMFLHATINLDESVAVAVQCDDGMDPRAGLSELNALIVHANGAAAALGPCGTPWESPFKDMSANKALEMLEQLSDNFRGDPKVFLNSPSRDGRVPVDIAARFGSARVAETLATHGALFLLRHLSDAQQNGNAALATFIGTQTPLRP